MRNPTMAADRRGVLCDPWLTAPPRASIRSRLVLVAVVALVMIGAAVLGGVMGFPETGA